MLVAWRYRKRKSIIQWFDPRAWLIFYACFLFSTLAFWDVRALLFFFVFTLIVLFNAGVEWREIRRAFIFILGFVLFFAFLTFLTGRGGTEIYKEEHLLRELKASFSIFGWTPTLKITVERIFFSLSQLVRISSISIMTVLIPYCSTRP
jgi:energy-coupling factor transport system permease protein